MCKEIGFDGTQGVLIPARNMRHLVLADEVVDAVAKGQFHIMTMNNVGEGIFQLTGQPLDEVNRLAAETLRSFKMLLEQNLPQNFLLKQ